MTAKEEVIDEIKSKISSLERCLNDKDWASTKSDYHIQIRKHYKSRVIIYKKLLSFLKKEEIVEL